MESGGRQILGLVLAIIGVVGSIIFCALPICKYITFYGAHVVSPQVIWRGLWMICVVYRYTGPFQCYVYNFPQPLPQDLQAARALVTIAIIAGFLGILLGVIGGKCTNFVEDEREKSKVAIASGVVFIVAGLLVLIPVCWTAHTIVCDPKNEFMATGYLKKLGASLYIGWGSAGLLFLGGGLLCSSCPPRDETDYNVKYSKAQSEVSNNADA